MSQKLVILDLDETLIFATETPLEHPCDFRIDEYAVYIRPHAREFIRFCFQHFRVAVWTSSTESYARTVIDELFGDGAQLEFAWARRRCTRKFWPERHDHEWLKDLTKVRRRGYRIEEIIVVDDTPAKLARSYGNLVRVQPFEGDRNDRELKLLMPYLTKLSAVPNVRNVEKRYWKSEIC